MAENGYLPEYIAYALENWVEFVGLPAPGGAATPAPEVAAAPAPEEADAPVPVPGDADIIEPPAASDTIESTWEEPGPWQVLSPWADILRTLEVQERDAQLDD